MSRHFMAILSILLFFSCATKFITPGFRDFNEASEVITDNIIYVFEKLQEEEMNLRLVEIIKKSAVKPGDFMPRVLTYEHLELRRELVKYITNYIELLLTVFEKDYKKDIMNNTKVVSSNLEAINSKHKGLLSLKDVGLISTIVMALPEALTYKKKRSLVLEIMKHNQSVLEKVIAKLKEEMETTKILINNFYARQFHARIEENWPNQISKREKVAKLAIEMMSDKYKTNVILDDIIRALGIIPSTHLELRNALKTNDNLPRTLKDLLDYAYRIKQCYENFSK